MNGGQFLYKLLPVIAIHQHESPVGARVSHPETPSHLPLHPIPLGCPRAPALRGLLHALNVPRSSILHVVIYMFQCYSLISSHPHLFPESPKVCSLHLCLFCCLAYRVVVTIIPNSIYIYIYIYIYISILIYCIGVSLSDSILYNRLQFHPPHSN